MSPKPREFWVYLRSEGYSLAFTQDITRPSDIKAYESIRVIEHSAYQALEQKLAVAIVALAYYQSAWDVGAKARQALAIINPDPRKEPAP